MPTINFDTMTEASVRKLKPGFHGHRDSKYAGIKLNVGKTRVTWYLRHRVGDKFKSVRLGVFPDMGIEAAKAKAKTHSNIQRDTSVNISTVRDAWAAHCKTRLANDKASKRHLDDLTRKLETHAADVLEMRPVDVTHNTVQNLIDNIQTGRSKNSAATKRHVRAALLSAFKRVKGMDNPVVDTEVPAANDRTPLWYELCQRDRNLDPEDLSYIWSAVWKKWEQNRLLGTVWIAMLFTGIRCEDVCSMRWSYDGEHGWVDLQRKSVTFPELKSGRKHMEIPLPAIVIDALRHIRAGSDDWVFPAASKIGYIGGGHGLDKLKADVPGHGVVPVVRPHDTRSFFQEACNEAMLPPNVMHFLRGDSKGDGSMLGKYTKRVGTSAPDMVQSVICERIKVVPSFDT